MPELKNYRLFISHSWAYGDAYERLINLFNKHKNFKWTDYSVPKNNPIHNAPKQSELYAAIKKQIAPTNCVIMLAGVYSTYSKWINKEINISKDDFEKPIVAIYPFRSKRISQTVKDNADIIVKWNSSSIVKAIREYSL